MADPTAILTRLVAEADTLGAAADWVQAALDGDAAMARAAAGAPPRASGPPPAAPGLPPVWLSGLEVRGLRGVGPAVRLPLVPGPGLTVVVGRNGSGKSSLAEGLEILLTGDSRRFEGRSAEWREGWRNLGGEPPAVEATFVAAGAGPFTVRRTWPEGASLGSGALSVPEALSGFEAAVATHRPFLGTSEMGRMFDGGPTRLFDALRGLLGGDVALDAVARLKAAQKTNKRALDDAKADARALGLALEDVADPRAAAVRAALRASPWDREVLRSAVAEDPVALPPAALALIGGTAAPWEPDGLAAAVTAAEGAEGTRAEIERRAAHVLTLALLWHDAHGDGPCPACGVGVLDAGWRTRALDWRVQREEAARAAQEAVAALAAAEDAARAWVAGLGPVDALEPEERSAVEAARALQGRSGRALLAHLSATAAPAWRATETARARWVAERERRRGGWAPFALRIAALLDRADATDAARDRQEALDAAVKWLVAVEAEARDAAFGPLAREAREIWGQLRQESSVSLDDLRLAGSGNRRRLELAVSVDEAPSVALSVMSQGEINALALALFVPRATRPENPFRFFVVDDPVQSMDPAKVDGLAQVLGSVARTRQVLVWTHDPRLPDALTRLRIGFTQVELSRRAGSRVELRHVRDPVAQHLLDAMRVARDPGVGALARRVVPGLCRAAVEALAVARVRARRLGRGEAAGDVEAELAMGGSLHGLLALLLFDDRKRHPDVMSRLDRLDRRFADTVRRLKEGAHKGDPDPVSLHEDTDRLCRALAGIP